MKKLLTITFFVLFMFLNGTAFASDEKLWGSHYYEMVNLPYTLTWDQAVIDANSRNYSGISGHLVAITSADESNALTGFLNEWQWTGNRWTGAYQEPG